MDYEKKYNYVLKRAEELKKYSLSPQIKAWVDNVFPELFESEDEKIRNALIIYLKCRISGGDFSMINNITINDMLAWLEKQVKETTISQHKNKTCKENDDSLTCENERVRKAIHIYLDWLDGRKDYAPKGKYTIKDMIAWLEKQKDYVSPQMVADAYLRGCNDTEKKWLEKQGQSFPILSNSSKTVKEWTEEDEKIMKCAVSFLIDFKYKGYENAVDCIEWIKSLKQRLEQ